MPKAKNPWVATEAMVRRAFHGMLRKDGTPMCEHSIAVGRMLADDGEDAPTVFGGYAHDLLEDTDVTEDGLRRRAERLLKPSDVDRAVTLAKECCYSAEEYALEKAIGGEEGKAARKEAACKRWLAGERSVRAIKRADVNHNRRSSASVSPEFEASYWGWAGPFHAGLEESLGERGVFGTAFGI